MVVSIDTERHMKQQRKHVLEFFQKDPWPVRVGVLAMWLTFLLAVAVVFSGLPDKFKGSSRISGRRSLKQESGEEELDLLCDQQN